MVKIMVVEPESMDECLYFTNRTMGELGKAKAWVYKKLCTECGKAKMGKPVEKGKVKIRAKEYVCPECGHVEEKKEHEESLNLELKYTCQECEYEGGGEAPYIWKTFEGVKSILFICGGCEKKIGITKKMKDPKKKK